MCIRDRASGLIAGGLDMKGAIFTILLGNVIVMIPILLNGHAGAKYGVPAPIYWRSAFGYKGATLPAIVSAVVAAGWYGIQIWIGGEALNTIIVALYPAWAEFSAGVWICFGLFWLANYAILVNGMGALKKMEAFCAPLLVLWMIILLIWAYNRAGTWGPLVRQTGNFASTGAFLAFFIPALTSNVGLSLIHILYRMVGTLEDIGVLTRSYHYCLPAKERQDECASA